MSLKENDEFHVGDQEFDFKYWDGDVEASVEDSLRSELMEAALLHERDDEIDHGLHKFLMHSVIIRSASFARFKRLRLIPVPVDADKEHMDLYIPEASRIEEIEYSRSTEYIAGASVRDEKFEKRATRFEASKELVEAWFNGYNSQFGGGANSLNNGIDVLSDTKFFREIERSVDKIISNFARLKSYDQKRYRITFGGQLLPNVESILADDLFLPPRAAVSFSDIFAKDVYKQLKVRSVFEGNWGKLIIDEDGELSLDLIPRRSKKLSSVLKG